MTLLPNNTNDNAESALHCIADANIKCILSIQLLQRSQPATAAPTPTTELHNNTINCFGNL